MKANTEALEISGRNLELQKKLEELGAVVKDLETKLALTGIAIPAMACPL